MPGFQYCSWCHGKGCMCCDSEQAKWKKREAERLEREANEDPRVKLRRLEDQRDIFRQSVIHGMTQEDRDAFNAKLDADIAAAQAECDAEYARQFPNGPVPMLIVSRTDGPDMDRLKSVFGREALERAFSEGGRGMAEIEENAAKARDEQMRYGPPKACAGGSNP